MLSELCAGPVNADVITLESMKFSLKQLLAVITLVGVALALTPWVHRTYCLLQIKSHAWGSG